MRRGAFETLFVSALAYTVIVSAAMPARAHEAVVYPVRPLEQRELDGLVDKARKTILGALRAAGEELKNGTDTDDAYGAYTAGDKEAGDVAEVVYGVGDGATEAETEAAEDGSGADPADPILTYLGTYVCTGYCPDACCCGEYASGYTASGTLATQGRTIACNSLPMGTQVMIDGVTYTVEDTGWSPYGEAWIDIFFDSHDAALAFGLQNKEVYLIGSM